MTKKRSTKWRIFDAAIQYLQQRKLLKESYGRDATGWLLDRDDLYNNRSHVVCCCALGAVYGGGGSIRAPFDVVESCDLELDALVRKKTRGQCENAGDYNDRSWVSKGDIIKLLTEARDVQM